MKICIIILHSFWSFCLQNEYKMIKMMMQIDWLIKEINNISNTNWFATTILYAPWNKGAMSRTGLPCLIMGVPPSKPKYPALTDSELVPWGKGETVPHEGSERDTEILGLQAVEVYPHKGGCRRTFCIMGQRVNLHSLLKPIGVGIARASLHQAWQHIEASYIVADL